MSIEDQLMTLREAFPEDYDVSVGPIKGERSFACQVDNDCGETVVAGNGTTVEEAVGAAIAEWEASRE